MAKRSNNAAVFLNLILILSALLLLSMAEGGKLFDVAFGKAKSTPQCDSVVGVGQNDTCFGITQLFNMTTEFFNAINPNLNCGKLFVGQWLCVAGTAN